MIAGISTPLLHHSSLQLLHSFDEVIIEHMFKQRKCPKCGKTIEADELWKFCPLCGKAYDAPATKKKRGNGQGSVTKISTGNWRASVVIGWKDATHPIRRTRSGFKTKTEALAYLPTLRENRPAEDYSPSVAEIFDEFISQHHRSASTITAYRAAFKHLQEFHDKEFKAMTINDWQRCMDNCPTGRQTKENIRVVLNLLYRYAIPRGWASPELMSFKGDFIRIDDKGSSTSEKTGFTEEELALLWKRADDVPFAGVILLMCYTGFRLGEFLSVEYKDGCLIGGSKTDAGKNRTVPVSPRVERFVPLIPHAMSQGAFRKQFYATLDACGIRNDDHRLTPHSTRHTFATLIKKVQAPDADKLRLIGHTSGKMLRYYQDVSVDDLRQITNML